MTTPDPRADLPTHRVENQPPARGDVDLYATDAPLREAVSRADGQIEALSDYGQTLGTTEMREAGRDANRYLPELRLFDMGGRRLDEVRFHPAYHRFMEAGVGAGYAALPWEGAKGAPSRIGLRTRGCSMR